MTISNSPIEAANAPQVSPEKLVQRLRKLLAVTPLEGDAFTGMAIPGGRGRMFGGQVIAQGLMAACDTVDSVRSPHSLHAYFLRAGDNALPVTYRVERDFDGGTFTNRRVVALQNDRPILSLTASFQAVESGFEHGTKMPDVPPPEELKTEIEHLLDNRDKLPANVIVGMSQPRPIELRPVYPRSLYFGLKREPLAHIWFRAAAPIVDGNQALHRSILAYASDMGLLSTSSLPHGVNWFTPGFQSASLDHAIWFHEDVIADEWMLYTTDSPWAAHSRGMNRGMIFSRDGRLIASTAQEGLMRMRTQP